MSSNSEFICEVVKIIELTKHPGADKLSLAKIQTKHGRADYTIVVRTGDFKEGQLAAYVGVDSVIPRGAPGFDFLFTGDRNTHRVKAARLRGIFSEGILVAAPKGCALGHELAEEWAISKYEPYTPGEPTQPSTKKKRNHPGWPDYSVLSLKKVPGYFQPGGCVEIREKIHGSNVRCGWHKGQFVVGSHHAIKTDIRPWYRRWWDVIRGRRLKISNYYGDDVWTKTVAKYAEVMKKYPHLVFYGEIYGPGIQDLTYDRATVDVVFFAIWDSKKKVWLDMDERNLVFYSLGLSQPPILFHGMWDGDLEKIKHLAEGKSMLASHVREGFVVNMGAAQAKYVGQGYLTRKSND